MWRSLHVDTATWCDSPVIFWHMVKKKIISLFCLLACLRSQLLLMFAAISPWKPPFLLLYQISTIANGEINKKHRKIKNKKLSLPASLNSLRNLFYSPWIHQSPWIKSINNEKFPALKTTKTFKILQRRKNYHFDSNMIAPLLPSSTSRFQLIIKDKYQS